MEPVEIHLKIRKEDIEEFFYSDGSEKHYFRQIFKKLILPFLLFVIFSITFYIWKQFESSASSLFWLCTVTGSSYFIYICVKAWPIYKLIIAVRIYTQNLIEFENTIVSLTDNTFSEKQDNNEYIEKWTELKNVIIHENGIWVTGKKSFLLPRKSMSPNEFELLREVISTKIKKVKP
jgi:hypothetical protein